MSANTQGQGGSSAISGLPTPPSPHLHTSTKANTIMRDVVIALLPAAIGSVYLFGAQVLPYYFISIGVAVLLDWLCRKVRKVRYRFDYTPVVTGMLLAMSIPANVPLWFPILGIFVAIVVAKELFGGVGRNFLNPAVTGRCVLRLLFVEEMTRNIWPRIGAPQPPPGLDATTGATPLMYLQDGISLTNEALSASFYGITGGKIGETSALLLLIGAAYLLVRKVIRLRIPVTLIATIAAIAWLWGGPDGFMSANYTHVLGHILGGATMLAAFYMATDYSSSPSTPWGQIIFAVGIGIITMLYRFFSEYSEGLTFAIVIMNLTVPLINRVTRPRVLGEERVPY
ncbi:MAG: RnfABCDGE type electron transport complex subunit D [Planctomycetes bacterium]|nr:RnfABCDGE type electron transport complex subunit D [Planctomycetota bacterium]